MYSTKALIAARLDENAEKEYASIFAPRVVATPPSDARRDICVLADGEIRVYGCDERTGKPVYIYSRDGGINFARRYAEEGDIGACVLVPWTGKYLTVNTDGKKVLRYLSSIGAGDTHPDVATVSETYYHDIFQPLLLEDCKKIIVTASRCDEKDDYRPTVMISRDGGESFEVKELPFTERFKPHPPHKSVRWNNNGAEPSVVRLADGRLWMLLRTSENFMYESFSDDCGESWSKFAPSRFHMTLTTPYALTLEDGRTVLFWNNTHPMPEQDKDSLYGNVDYDVRRGKWEDVFTNRDASHAAITEDCGKTFIGMREVVLSPLRHFGDYRTFGGYHPKEFDKSVHQHQAIELPHGKILLAVGQNEVSRKLVIFDIGWLYEHGRCEDFKSGYANISVQGYIKSLSGTAVGMKIPGHCQWNRVPSAMLVPDPAGSFEEALQFAYSDDPRLFNGVSGMTYNFPAEKRGRAEIKVCRAGAGLHIGLSDVWINPTDTESQEVTVFAAELENELKKGEYVTVSVTWDTEAKKAVFEVSGAIVAVSELKNPAPFGISYLHIQSLARARDYDGSFVKNIEICKAE